MTQKFNLTAPQKSFIVSLLKNDYFGNETINLNGEETPVQIYIKEIPKRKDLKSNFFDMISSLEEIGVIVDNVENEEGELFLYIKDEDMDELKALSNKNDKKKKENKKEEKSSEIKLTELEQKFYRTFINNLSSEEISENGTTEICYKGGVEGMSVYQLGAVISTLIEKGVIVSIDKKEKILLIKVL